MSRVDSIPFVDLVAPHVELEEELGGVVNKAFQTGGFIGGPMVEEFEQEFAKACGVPYCVGVSSGTDALRFALMAAGVWPGDSVITVPNTFIATTEAISQAGALPEFVDIDPQTYNLDPFKLLLYLETGCVLDPVTGKPISRKTGRPVTAVVPVHLYGQMAAMDSIRELAKRYGLIVIEDACQAHGSEYFSAEENRWRKAGSIGDAAAFSFYPGKNLGACGEGGAVTTHNEQIARRVRRLRDHGQSQKFCHDVEGYNGRLDAIQAGMLTVKLPRLSAWNAQRREIAARYNQLLGPLRDALKTPHEPDWAMSNYHLYVIQVQQRDELRGYLSKAHVETGIHYPIPLHLQKAYEYLGYPQGSFPVTESAAAEILSLPMYPQLGLEDQKYIADKAGEFIEANSAPAICLTAMNASLGGQRGWRASPDLEKRAAAGM
ncbi:MAG TPA: DegT/DnrJ/EryC1/StrS family aminotransferase [Terriglobia bacterium]|nr:DegT/DnrJ/EryC1/StrS family aminotransferase [Terriglobia bacterium]